MIFQETVMDLCCERKLPVILVGNFSPVGAQDWVLKR